MIFVMSRIDSHHPVAAIPRTAARTAGVVLADMDSNDPARPLCPAQMPDHLAAPENREAPGQKITSGTEWAEAATIDLGRALGVPFTRIPPPPTSDEPLEKMAMLRSYAVRNSSGAETRVIAPNAALANLLERQYRTQKLPSIILTTHQALIDAIVGARRSEITTRATMSLEAGFSARASESVPSWRFRAGYLAAIAMAFLLLVMVLLFPLQVMVIAPLLLAPLFMLAALAVLTAAIESLRPGSSPARLLPGELPRYSILVPLYREGNIVGDLIDHLSRLDYPRDRIEIFLLVEEDDAETRQALREHRLPEWFRVFVVPPGAPRTKPRALNAALPFCTGEYLVIYDAEDEPEPDQLLRAAARFREMPADVACLQARLGISNSYDGFLTRRFAIDYAALFDCIKCGSARAGWAVPLGGSSNHFRRKALLDVGAWDAWNVTEDADLGIRLARFGWRVEDLVSTTWEEAPNTLAAWMNQRTRWMKGWMQSAAVHLRSPGQMLTALGLFRTTILVVTVFSVLAGSALYPLFLLAITLRVADPLPFGEGGSLLALGDASIIVLVAAAVLAETVPATIALRRRRALHLLPYVMLAPITHLLTSFATWRAAIELVRRPYHWHKTMHGKARHEGRLGSLKD